MICRFTFTIPTTAIVVYVLPGYYLCFTTVTLLRFPLIFTVRCTFHHCHLVDYLFPVLITFPYTFTTPLHTHPHRYLFPFTTVTYPHTRLFTTHGAYVDRWNFVHRYVDLRFTFVYDFTFTIDYIYPLAVTTLPFVIFCVTRIVLRGDVYIPTRVHSRLHYYLRYSGTVDGYDCCLLILTRDFYLDCGGYVVRTLRCLRFYTLFVALFHGTFTDLLTYYVRLR